jgi:hypothetical protein
MNGGDLAGVKFRQRFWSETNDVVFDKRIRDKPVSRVGSHIHFRTSLQC